MTIKKSQLREFGEAVKATQPQKTKGYFAILGTLTGEVLTGVSNLVYITTFEGQTLTVINRRVPNHPGSVVFVGSDDYSANRIEILYTLNIEGATNDGSSAGSTLGVVPPHSHSAGSLDPTWVYDSQFTPLLVLPISGTLTVQVYPGAIRKTNSTGWKYIAGQVVDLSGDIPASGACWALLQANDDGTVDAVIGSTQAARADLDETDIPEPTTGKGIVAIVLEAGYTELYRNNTRNDFLDLRFDKAGDDEMHTHDASEITGQYRRYVVVALVGGGWSFVDSGADAPVETLANLE